MNFKQLKNIFSLSLTILFFSVFLFLTLDFIVSSSFKQFLLDKYGEGGILRTTIYHYDHDLRKNVDVNVVWGPRTVHRFCTNQYGFKDRCDNVGADLSKHFNIGFIGDSNTEGVGLIHEDTFVGRFSAANPDLKIANLAVVSYSPSIYYMKIKWLLENGFYFDKIVILPDVSDLADDAMV